jgi:hypothetical protein
MVHTLFEMLCARNHYRLMTELRSLNGIWVEKVVGIYIKKI